MLKINGETFNVKDKIVELIQTNKFIVNIPKEYWKNEYILKATMNKIENTKKKDISILESCFAHEDKCIKYKVMIHDLTEYLIEAKLDGTIDCTQLSFKTLDINNLSEYVLGSKQAIQFDGFTFDKLNKQNKL